MSEVRYDDLPGPPFDLILSALFGDEPEFTPRCEKGHRRPRGYASWRPQRESRILIGQVNEVLTAYQDFLPLTVRQIFYRLVASFGYPKDENAYERLGDKVNRARRARLIPFDVIRDDTLISYSSPWYDGQEAFWDEVGRQIKSYRTDRQAGQRQWMPLWCEAAGMGPQLDRVAREYSVPVFSGTGTASLTGVRHVVDGALAREVPTVLLHVGDFDPYGESIFNALAEDAIAFLEEDRIIGTQRIEPVRVALTDAEVRSFGLPTQATKPPKRKSKAHETIRKRWIRRYGDRTCQLEALAPDDLAKVVRQEIESHLDLDLRRRRVEQEERDRVAMYRALPAGGES
jgi:hypothetical protein